MLIAAPPAPRQPGAVKLVTVLGVLALPATCWAAFRVLHLREPAPLLAACAATVFLFMSQVTPTQQFTIWGGNIASTMAGEFPFSISFALLPLALAVLWRVCEDGKGWRAAALLVAAVVLSHILTTIVLVLGATGLVLRGLWPRPCPRSGAWPWSWGGVLSDRILGPPFCWLALPRARPLGPARVLHLCCPTNPALSPGPRSAGWWPSPGERRVLLFAWPGDGRFVFVPDPIAPRRP